jgi:hypothetical protein
VITQSESVAPSDGCSPARPATFSAAAAFEPADSPPPSGAKPMIGNLAPMKGEEASLRLEGVTQESTRRGPARTTGRLYRVPVHWGQMTAVLGPYKLDFSSTHVSIKLGAS